VHWYVLLNDGDGVCACCMRDSVHQGLLVGNATVVDVVNDVLVPCLQE